MNILENVCVLAFNLGYVLLNFLFESETFLKEFGPLRALPPGD